MRQEPNISSRIVDLIAALGDACDRLKTANPGLTARDVETALVDQLGLDAGPDLLGDDWTPDAIIATLADYDFGRLRPQIIDEVHLEHSIIPYGVPRLLTEERVKYGGDVWTIHKSYSVPFPSNPHAHNYATGHKMHLGTGALFIRRREVGRVSKKDLEELRSRVRHAVLPPLGP